jgi:hypothetical protein
MAAIYWFFTLHIEVRKQNKRLYDNSFAVGDGHQMTR